MNEKIDFNYHDIIGFQGYLLDDEKLIKSSSGGVARAFMETILKRKGIVFGATYSNDFYSAHYCYIENENEIERLIGSKYIYTDKKVSLNKKTVSIYEAVSYFLELGKEVLFIGLGCDIAALSKLLGNRNVDTSNLYLVDLICQGPTFPKVEESYLKYLEKKFDSKVCDFSVRYKQLGWTPPYIRVKFENGKEYTESFYGSDFGYAFSKYSRPSCFKCKNKGENHKSDITIGDFWGLEKEDIGFNKNGVSAILVKTEKGKKLVDLLDETRFKIMRADVTKILVNNPMYYKCRKQNEQQEAFMQNLNVYGLHEATKKEIGSIKYSYFKIRRAIGKSIRNFRNKN
ncbi:MAG: Coenzyme F420 hydrogenase/dehydrogenase, beta subunit C-terminal domain [Clostridium sp.]|nr:Coenzyme F420 hydrogenase/dehydrogenase, beta subunit C-terminal domain [Clostridium sp.]